MKPFKPGMRVACYGEVLDITHGAALVAFDGNLDSLLIPLKKLRPLRPKRKRVWWFTHIKQHGNIGVLEIDYVLGLEKYIGKRVRVTVELLEGEK